MLLAATLLAGATPAAERDWGATLRSDAQALHDDIAANHPGPVNADDPGFARRNDAELKRALARSRTARTYGDYYFALREYVASFDDGHLSFGATGATPNTDRWPGFLTRYDGDGAIRVFMRSADSPVPVDARLIDCDGRPAARFAAATLGRSWGRWQLESQRLDWGKLLLVDQGNRYVRMPARCTFEVEGRRRTVRLDWKPFPFDLARKILSGGDEARRGFGARTLADGTRWYALPSFDGDPRSDAGKALQASITGMQTERAALSRAPAIVLDLRGNGGGSSDWSQQIATVLWGTAAVNAAPAPKMTVRWRASLANLATLEKVYAKRRAGASPDVRAWFESSIAGLKRAIARHDPPWNQTEDDDRSAPSVPPPPSEPVPPLAGPVYVLTDARCASACLDAVDLWTSLGAIQLGRTTSADTLYMEVRFYRLPSGLTSGGMPMKVYTGRARGSNVPAVPRYRFDGDIADTAALEKWVATVPRR